MRCRCFLFSLFAVWLPVQAGALPVSSNPYGGCSCRTGHEEVRHSVIQDGLPESTVTVYGKGFVASDCVFDSCFVPFMSASRLILREGNSAVLMQEKHIDVGRELRYGLQALPSETPGIRLQADSTLKRLRRVQRDLYVSGGFDEAAEKRKIIEGLRTFGDTAAYVPVVYATIHTTYGGDVARYVDDLFERSAMTNRRRMMRVTRWPRKRRMQGDMGFQLSLSKQLYMAWEAMGRPSQLIGHFVIPNKWKK